MSGSGAAARLATAADLAALGADVPAEIVGGAIVEKTSPSAEHGDAQLGLGSFVRERFHRGGSDGARPGGWWILSEVEVELETHEVYVPDLWGWRRGRVPARPVRILRVNEPRIALVARRPRRERRHRVALLRNDDGATTLEHARLDVGGRPLGPVREEQRRGDQAPAPVGEGRILGRRLAEVHRPREQSAWPSSHGPIAQAPAAHTAAACA